MYGRNIDIEDQVKDPVCINCGKRCCWFLASFSTASLGQPPSSAKRTHWHEWKYGLLQNRKVTLLTPQGRATKDQKQGYPQSSCSGPALWNLVANEILNQVWPDNVHVQAFADDFVLVIKADTNNSLVEDTQSAITQFSSWCSENELAISTEETNYILFSKMVRSPKITWNGYKINRVKSFKYLGIHVDDRLNWLEHINNQGEKAIKMQQNLKRIAGGNWGICQIHRWTLHKTVVERMPAHGSSAWCLNPTFKMKRKLSSIQRPFLLHMSGAYRTTPTTALQTILGTPTHAITVRSQVYVNLSPKNPSSPYHYRYPKA
ncbi:Putative protein in type-1 retrotransposable element R1DM [Araneus ventricosus]|uniref:Reverse transcriptase domain-containing protein n=1 Tax=Araneus ventricosus TaxID=182803 RepID=A0A4Y2FMX9_ARAVE|nr:Putative protein in type-1 retrotransposable element R1DM [Araneus ventricosus]